MPRSAPSSLSRTGRKGPRPLLPSHRRSRLGDATLSATLTLCRLIGAMAAAVDMAHRPRATLRVMRALRELSRPPWAALRRVWFGRTAREVLDLFARFGGRASLGVRIDVAGDIAVIRRPCVLVALHSDWWRVLAPHIPESLDLALVAGRRWQRRVQTAAAIPPSGGLRELLAHLDGGGSAALSVDHFSRVTGEGCRCEILGRSVSVPLTAARLSARNDLPLVPVTICHRQGRFLVTLGSPITARDRIEEAMREAFNVLAASAAEDPSSWGCLLRFLRASPGT